MAKIDILKIAKLAQSEKKKNPNVIDATIGMFYDDDQQLVIHEVAEAFRNLNVLETFKYGATDGGKEFEQNLLDWVFDEKRAFLESKFKLAGVSTPGGSGALSMVFNSYGMIGSKALVSQIRWRYDYFLKAAKMGVHTFNLFKDGTFDLKSFEKELMYLTRIQKRVIVIINDPCHNPTGYQLSDDEWQSIIHILNRFNQNEIILTLDIAYFDYHKEGFKAARNMFDYLMPLKQHVSVMICFSASKSFAIYGVRLGGLIGLYHHEEDLRFFKKDVLDDALGKWSTAPSVGVGIFNQIAKSKDSYIDTLNRLTNILSQRGAIFLKEAQEVGLTHHPYRGGFFVLIHSKDAVQDYEKLAQVGIYVIPMEDGLRVALCGITTKEVQGLARKIKNVILG